MPEEHDALEPADEETAPGLWDRIKLAIIRSDADTDPRAPRVEPTTLEEAQAAVPANDKERMIGLVAAPVAALISVVIIGNLLKNDPSAYFADGSLNKAHVNPSLYHELLFVLLGLSVLMLAMAWYRKRLFLAIATALYGLAVFNLHYWGFGVPFLLFGAWLLVRAYRVQQDIKAVTPDDSGGSSAPTSGPTPKATPNKRYTQPSRRAKKLPPASSN